MLYFCFFSCRAFRELDGHEGDPGGGHGVSPQIPGGDDGGAAQRGGAFRCRRQEDSCHGKELLNLLLLYNFPAEDEFLSSTDNILIFCLSS